MARVTVTDEESGRRVRQPSELIVTIYGLYAREAAGWLSVASLIRLMAEVNVDEPAVRSSISRLKRRGILVAQRSNGLAGYGLPGPARAILDEGDRRIFRRQRAVLADGWLLAVFSVPEAERNKRHLLRSRLSWLGFGTVAAGVWVAPAHLLDETRDALERQDLATYVDLFQAGHLGFADLAGQVGRWWDLPRLQQLHDEFLSGYAPVRTSVRRRRSIADRQAFGCYVTALTDWRRLPYADPGLPAEVLPRNWRGLRAAETFFELHDRLAGPAHAYVSEVRDGVEKS